MTDKRCGNCSLHHDLTGLTEEIGVKNCMALPSDLCAGVLSTVNAVCTFPEKFILKAVKDVVP